MTRVSKLVSSSTLLASASPIPRFASCTWPNASVSAWLLRSVFDEGLYVSGIVASPEGITNPPIDDLLEIASSKYALVIYSAKRARQINAYYSQLGEGLLEYVGPLVETHPHEKPLSVALREINAKMLTAEPVEA